MTELNKSAIADTREYLGDGVYAMFDGYQVWLSTQRDGGWEQIALEPGTYSNLIAYAEKWWRKKP